MNNRIIIKIANSNNNSSNSNSKTVGLLILFYKSTIKRLEIK